MRTVIAIVIAILVAALVLRFLIMPILLRRGSPRLQHYVFAHQLLPQTLFANPFGVVIPLVNTATDRSKAEGAELLNALWNDADIDPAADTKIEWDSSKYEVTCLSHPNNMVIVIPLPEPLKKAEAYYAAMVVDSPGMAAGHIRQLRYFVLENVAVRDGRPKTYLSEWSPKNSENPDELEYKIHFEDVEPTIPAFLEKIESLLPTKLPIPGGA